jgi:hypothetical protein
MKSPLRLKAEELLKDFAPFQVAENLFNESGYADLDTFKRKIRSWKSQMSKTTHRPERKIESIK